MIFEYFGCLGTSPGGLGHHFEPKARIFMILVTFPPESSSPLWLLFCYFLDAFFSAFSGTPLEGTFCKLWLQRHPTGEALGGRVGYMFGEQQFIEL